ncbi:hypothetical protein MSMEI_3297 [Mycolicibacterium smegmatis MC2 155]|uniref:Uncharacterized protein n=1 Tax=Mycolicibacterium smegmatis (strain ATCC 700084 / mc(2)155) TaxID=246196 RepID=I7FE29_MYCS2|nr:hypothetical protein MSMEI_3297 [Mycolicibacterium smegmatis MC2 155]
MICAYCPRTASERGGGGLVVQVRGRAHRGPDGVVVVRTDATTAVFAQLRVLGKRRRENVVAGAVLPERIIESDNEPGDCLVGVLALFDRAEAGFFLEQADDLVSPGTAAPIGLHTTGDRRTKTGLDLCGGDDRLDLVFIQPGRLSLGHDCPDDRLRVGVLGHSGHRRGRSHRRGGGCDDRRHRGFQRRLLLNCDGGLAVRGRRQQTRPTDARHHEHAGEDLLHRFLRAGCGRHSVFRHSSALFWGVNLWIRVPDLVLPLEPRRPGAEQRGVTAHGSRSGDLSPKWSVHASKIC